MTHVLYFLDHEKVILVSLTDEMGGFTVEVKLEDLFAALLMLAQISRFMYE